MLNCKYYNDMMKQESCPFSFNCMEELCVFTRPTQDDYLQLEQELSEHQTIIHSLRSEYDNLDSEYNTLEQERDELLVKINELTEENIRLNGQINQAIC